MTIKTLDLEERTEPYLIAEIGVNYFDIAEQLGTSPLDAAKQMVSEAATAGVDAVKFQSYSAEHLASKNSPAYWDTDKEATQSQYELFKKFDDFEFEEFEEVASWAVDYHSVDFLSTPFDVSAVDYLEPLLPAYKVASGDITNHPLLRRIAQKGKPILLSTGASTIGEIDEAISVIEAESDCVEIVLLHCILDYPTNPADANLGMIDHLSGVYPQFTIGYSDHVPPDNGMITLLNAVVKGANIIEKHFTLDKTLTGNDHYHAMSPEDVEIFRENLNTLFATSGGTRKMPIPAEGDGRKHARRSLVAAQDIAEGELITRNHLSIKRPGTGIPPKMIDVIVGRVSRTDVSRDEILSWDMV